MNVFIDTQIWLSFYHYSTDDLEALRKLGVLMDQRKVRLHLPEQIVEEFRRNREAKYIDAMKKFKDEKLNDQFPQLARQYEAEYKQMEEAVAAYKAAKKRLIEQIDAHYEKEELRADEVIRELFGKGTQYPITPEIVALAQLRYHKRNPPGKGDSLGDAINWECLLAALPKNCNLYFISDDVDYRSKKDDASFEPFLRWEWKTKNGGEILFYRRLTSFFKAVFPDINLTEEVEKEELIQELADSGNWSETHVILDKMTKYPCFSTEQVNAILRAATTNKEVYLISTDWDVNDVIRKIIDNHNFDLDPDLYELYVKYYVDVEVDRPKKRGRRAESTP